LNGAEIVGKFLNGVNYSSLPQSLRPIWLALKPIIEPCRYQTDLLVHDCRE
jgi:hypothetical protein